jgi:site-specific recombinase XerD
LNRTFATRTLASVTADEIELYLRDRLRQRIRIRTGLGCREGRRTVKATTVHQELRVLRRILNVAVRKKLISSNPCSGVEFPVMLKGLFRPHYVSWSEQQRIENNAPEYLHNIVRIISETSCACTKNFFL